MPRPVHTPTSVIVKVHACSLNPIDSKIKKGCLNKLGVELRDHHLRNWLYDCPMMKGWKECIQTLLDANFEVAIISGGMQHTARQIAAEFPSGKPWRNTREQSTGITSSPISSRMLYCMSILRFNWPMSAM